MIKKVIIIFISFVFIFLLSLPLKANAEPQVEAALTVSAIVPSKVSEVNSYVTLSANETLVDPVNHSVLMTVYLFDASNNPLANLPVVTTSNRGQVDIIEAINKIGTGDPNMNKDSTDVNGKVAFRLGSWMAGDAVFSTLADNLVELEDQKVKFLPLPFPAQLTVSIPIPYTPKKITLISPPKPVQPLTPAQEEAKKLVNVGTEISIPFWVLVLAAVLIIATPLLLSLNFHHLRKIRKQEDGELDLLKKINNANHIDHLRNELGQSHPNYANRVRSNPPKPPQKDNLDIQQ